MKRLASALRDFVDLLLFAYEANTVGEIPWTDNPEPEPQKRKNNA